MAKMQALIGPGLDGVRGKEGENLSDFGRMQTVNFLKIRLKVKRR